MGERGSTGLLLRAAATSSGLALPDARRDRFSRPGMDDSMTDLLREAKMSAGETAPPDLRSMDDALRLVSTANDRLRAAKMSPVEAASGLLRLSAPKSGRSSSSDRRRARLISAGAASELRRCIEGSSFTDRLSISLGPASESRRLGGALSSSTKTDRLRERAISSFVAIKPRFIRAEPSSTNEARREGGKASTTDPRRLGGSCGASEPRRDAGAEGDAVGMKSSITDARRAGKAAAPAMSEAAVKAVCMRVGVCILARIGVSCNRLRVCTQVSCRLQARSCC